MFKSRGTQKNSYFSTQVTKDLLCNTVYDLLIGMLTEWNFIIVTRECNLSCWGVPLVTVIWEFCSNLGVLSSSIKALRELRVEKGNVPVM